MKFRVTALCLLVLLSLSGITKAADTKVGGRMYISWMDNLTDGSKGENAFSVDRTYLDVKSKLSEWTSGRLTSDLKSTDDGKGKTRYDVIIKYAYFDWMPQFAQKKLTVRFGLQPTLYIDDQNGMWGRRYLSKTVGDEYGILTSSDFGAAAILGLGKDGKMGNIVGTVFQGTSYSSTTEMNKRKDVELLAFVKPLTNNEDLKRTALIARLYTGAQNVAIPDSVSASDYKRQIVSFGGLFAYRHTFDVGIDANFETEGTGPGTPDLKWTAHSAYGAFYLQDLVAPKSPLRTLNLFGRVDRVDPNTNTDNDATTYLIAGVECVPVSGFKASVNFRSAKPQNNALTTEKGLYVNTLFKF